MLQFLSMTRMIQDPFATVQHALYQSLIKRRFFLKTRITKARAVVTSKTSANTDLNVAIRVVKKMDNSPHRSAIEVCLDVNWLPEGRKVILEEADTRAGLFARVIDPIEKEIEMLTRFCSNGQRDSKPGTISCIL
jgi:hypothetical protein